jgi:hypothetical protein
MKYPAILSDSGTTSQVLYPSTKRTEDLREMLCVMLCLRLSCIADPLVSVQVFA